jgi:hypothetical protein
MTQGYEKIDKTDQTHLISIPRPSKLQRHAADEEVDRGVGVRDGVRPADVGADEKRLAHGGRGRATGVVWWGGLQFADASAVSGRLDKCM